MQNRLNETDGWAGKVAVVTGGGSGIGQAAATRLVRAGAFVLITGRRPAPLTETEKLHPNIKGVTADVSVSADATKVVEKAVALWGGIDVLINNAGAFAVGPLESVNAEAVTRLFATNVLGPTLLIKEALPHLRKSRGSVVNVSSTYGHKTAAQAAHYGASKAALEHLTRSWSVELSPYGIRVNAVAPGPTDTPILRNSGLPPQVVQAIQTDEKAGIPLGRRGIPAEVAEWIVSLADPQKAEWITGQVLSVDGGLSVA